MSGKIELEYMRNRLKAAFLEVLKQLDRPAAENAAHRDLVGLHNLIAFREAIPKSVRVLSEVLYERAEHEPLPARIQGYLSECNDWLAEKGLPPLEKFDIVAPIAAETTQPATHVSSSEPPLPVAWEALVPEIRARLLDGTPRAPFVDWTLPQLRDSSTWCEHYEALPCHDALTGIRATVLVPTETARSSRAARFAWEHRVNAATRLRLNGLLPETVATILDSGEDTTPGYIILRTAPVSDSLRRRIQAGDPPSPHESVELGIALCQILSFLNGRGVSVRDLSTARIAYKNSAAQRLVHLMDPAAVIPAPGVLPEFRLATDLTDKQLQSPEPSQVFLVGALVLALICKTSELLRTGSFPTGQSASLASLAGQRQFADEPADRITGPLVAELQQAAREYSQRVHADRAVEALRWSVAESRDDRYPSLGELAAALRKSIAH